MQFDQYDAMNIVKEPLITDQTHLTTTLISKFYFNGLCSLKSWCSCSIMSAQNNLLD